MYYLADYSPVTSTNTRLYRKKNNGFMRKKLVDAKVSFFTIHDHALYFLSPDAAYRSGIYRMELDGSNLRLVAETTASSFKIVGDTLYFLEGGYDGNAQPQDILYTCPLTGGGKLSGARSRKSWISSSKTAFYTWTPAMPSCRRAPTRRILRAVGTHRKNRFLELGRWPHFLYDRRFQRPQRRVLYTL
ncbi:MAG: DUF5050 domain-containing protein [Oscillospiraceae bacterium]